jgi:MoxR-like ATPase
VVGAAAAQVALGDAALRACTKLRRWLAGQGVAVSDRRWRQWIALMRTAAATEGRSEVDAMDLWLAPYVASPAPEWAPRIAQWFEAELLQAVPRDAPWLTRAVEAFEKQLEVEQSAPPEDDGGDEGGTGKLGLARAIGRGETGETGASMPRIVSERLEARSRRRYSPVHVAARTAQVDAVLAQSRAARQTHDAERAQLVTALAPRLWVPPALGQRWLSAHDRTLQVIDTLVARLENARAGYAALTLDGAAPAVAPAPVDVATSDG